LVCDRVLITSVHFVIELLKVAVLIKLVGLCIYILAGTSKKVCRCCDTKWSC